MMLGQSTWFTRAEDDRLLPNLAPVRAFMRSFFRLFCERQGICTAPAEQQVLDELVDYNVLCSPKPKQTFLIRFMASWTNSWLATHP